MAQNNSRQTIYFMVWNVQNVTFSWLLQCCSLPCLTPKNLKILISLCLHMESSYIIPRISLITSYSYCITVQLHMRRWCLPLPRLNSPWRRSNSSIIWTQRKWNIMRSFTRKLVSNIGQGKTIFSKMKLYFLLLSTQSDTNH